MEENPNINDVKPSYNWDSESNNMNASNLNASNTTLQEIIINALREEVADLQQYIGNADDLKAQLAEKDQECAVLKQQLADMGTFEDRLAQSAMTRSIEKLTRQLGGAEYEELVSERDDLISRVEALEEDVRVRDVAQAENDAARSQLNALRAILSGGAQSHTQPPADATTLVPTIAHQSTPTVSTATTSRRADVPPNQDLAFRELGPAPPNRHAGANRRTAAATNTSTSSTVTPMNPSRSSQRSKTQTSTLAAHVRRRRRGERSQSSSDDSDHPPSKKQKTIGMFGEVPSDGFRFDSKDTMMKIEDLRVRMGSQVVNASKLPANVRAAISDVLDFNNTTHGIRTPRRTPIGRFVCLTARSRYANSSFDVQEPPTGPCPFCSAYTMPGYVCVVSVRHESGVLEFGVMPRSVRAAATRPNEATTWLSNGRLE